MLWTLDPIQVITTICQFSEAIIRLPLSFIYQGAAILCDAAGAISVWISSYMGIDYFILLAFFSAGFWLFHPRALISKSIRHICSSASLCVNAEKSKRIDELDTDEGDASITTSSLPNKDLEDKETIFGTSDEEKPQSLCSESSQCSVDFAPLHRDGHGKTCLPNRRRRHSFRRPASAHPPKLSEGCTTVILRDLHRGCTPHAFLACLHENGYFGKVDLVYVPIDFKHVNFNLGFAVVNFNSCSACLQFAEEFHSASACDKFSDSLHQNVFSVTEALIQGREVNVDRLQQSPILNRLMRYPTWLPLKVDAGGLAMPLEAKRPKKIARRRSSK